MTLEEMFASFVQEMAAQNGQSADLSGVSQSPADGSSPDPLSEVSSDVASGLGSGVASGVASGLASGAASSVNSGARSSTAGASTSKAHSSSSNSSAFGETQARSSDSSHTQQGGTHARRSPEPEIEDETPKEAVPDDMGDVSLSEIVYACNGDLATFMAYLRQHPRPFNPNDEMVVKLYEYPEGRVVSWMCDPIYNRVMNIISTGGYDSKPNHKIIYAYILSQCQGLKKEYVKNAIGLNTNTIQGHKLDVKKDVLDILVGAVGDTVISQDFFRACLAGVNHAMLSENNKAVLQKAKVVGKISNSEYQTFVRTPNLGNLPNVFINKFHSVFLDPELQDVTASTESFFNVPDPSEASQGARTSEAPQQGYSEPVEGVPSAPVDIIDATATPVEDVVTAPVPVPAGERSTEDLIREQQELQKRLEEINGQIQSQEDFMKPPSIKDRVAKIKESILNKTQDWEDMPEQENSNKFMGQPFQYGQEQSDFKPFKKFKRSENAEENAKSYVDLQREFTEAQEKAYGGWENVSSFAVISDKLIINGIERVCKLSPEDSKELPIDIRNSVANNGFAWLFDFSALRKMKNLANLKFDTEDFPYTKVRKDLGIRYDFAPSSFFKVCKHLMYLEIGSHQITASEPQAQDKNLFYRARRSEEIYNKCLDFGWDKTQYGWNSIKNVYHDPDRGLLSKAWGITWRGVGTSAAGVGTLGVKMGGIGAKAAKGVGNFFSSLKSNLK